MTVRVVFVFAVFLLCCQAAFCADPYSGGFAQDVSDSLFPFLAVGEASLLLDGHKGRNAATQGLKALVVTDLATAVIKATVRERRPNRESYNSFPSRHAAAAFCMAAVISGYDSDWRIPAYGAASLIGWSRVETRNHYWHDVIGGAALGYFVARAFTKDNSAFSSRTVGCSFSW